ncbi:MAG: hypothetical protein BWX50_01570 [Euryarchaeota archaeon ADurb.Bin009]|nr:MAG: hypothetical protein BWX50_01570 [Euryarchaeota archaeon ADurb.Bin009]
MRASRQVRASSIVCMPDPHPTSRIPGRGGRPASSEKAFLVHALLPGPWRGRPSCMVKMKGVSMTTVHRAAR